MPATRDDIDLELLPLFIEEADELYPQAAEFLKAWRINPDDALLQRKLQRCLHTFKGSARMSGAMRIGEAIHQMEGRVLDARAPYSAAHWTYLEDSLAKVEKMLGEVKRGASSESLPPAEEPEAQQATLSEISKRLYRITRQTGKELRKKANLELEGTEVKLDRGVLERMTAPLEHLLRNAIAHGLENPATREDAGKPPVGEIRLSLRREPEEIVFEFSDDGAGLDVLSLRRRGVELGLLPPGAPVSDQDVMQLVFVPGLSTATEVTKVAGRGMGMDVVLSEIATLGGRISVSSAPGSGVCFLIRLPANQCVAE